MFFYKPPNDRASGIKDLFPVSLVPPSHEEEDNEHPGLEAAGSSFDSLSPRPKTTRQDSNQSFTGRKKRAFWGRRTHPDLICDPNSGAVEKGTFEALVHEAVFATTFLGPSVTPSEVIKGLTEEEKHQKKLSWYEFATSVLISVPLVVSGGQPVFEAEFLRCCSYLISGADESVREEEKSRVAWLANEYIQLHGHPADPSAWEAWQKDTIPVSAQISNFASSGLTVSIFI